jgi:hypothetical protein
MSWLVAMSYTFGSLVWIVNGFLVVLPVTQPESEFPGEVSYAGGWSAFAGGTIFLRRELAHEDGSADHGASPSTKPRARQWLPSWQELKNHYIYEIGFIACGIQLTASVLFWASKFLAIPQISDRVSKTTLIGAYWTPSVIGGIGFIVSSTILVLETQPAGTSRRRASSAGTCACGS